MKKNTKRGIVISTIVALSLCVGIAIGYLWGLFETQPYKYYDHVTTYAEEYGVPEELLYGVIKVESNFDKDARSRVGAMGLMQMMPRTFEWLTSKEHLGEHLPVASLYTPKVSIRYGAYYLNYLYERFGDWNTVLAAYNGGEGNVSKWLKDEAYSDDGVTLKDIPFAETKAYVEKVNAAMENYEILIKK